MSVRRFVVDTSTWIDFFSGQEAPELEDALAAGTVVLSPVVVAELLSGAGSPAQRAALTDLLFDLPVHETPLPHWVRVGDLRRELRGQGISVSTPDAHVAQCALDHGSVLLSRDRVFERIADLVGLQVRPG